jgi:hypothetical protein
MALSAEVMQLDVERARAGCHDTRLPLRIDDDAAFADRMADRSWVSELEVPVHDDGDRSRCRLRVDGLEHEPRVAPGPPSSRASRRGVLASPGPAFGCDGCVTAADVPDPGEGAIHATMAAAADVARERSSMLIS